MLTDSTFTWKDLDYTVKADGKDKQLLRKVTGYCKAGTITALMGSSGAGKVGYKRVWVVLTIDHTHGRLGCPQGRRCYQW